MSSTACCRMKTPAPWRLNWRSISAKPDTGFGRRDPDAARAPRSRLVGNERQHRAIVAVAQAGGLRPVLEDVAMLAAAACAVVFGARRRQFQVGLGFHMAGRRIVEAGPAGAAVVFEPGGEERQSAGPASTMC